VGDGLDTVRLVFDAVLFDLDGTITDPVVGITASFRHALASVGHPVEDDVDLRWVIGPPLRHNFERHGLADHLHDEAVLAFRERHTEIGLFEADLVDGMVDVLDALVLRGVPLGLATAKPVVQAVTTLEHFGLADRFRVVAGAPTDGGPHGKEIIVADAVRRLAELEVRGRIAMVGDRRHDIDAGRHNGCVTVAVEWGYAEAGELDAAHPDLRCATPAELLSLLVHG
jgi:phosphoglycolate phosphatase